MTAGLFEPGYALWRNVEGVDQYGNPITNWAQIANVTGRAYPTAQTDDVVAARRVGKVTWTFAAPATAGVQAGDQVRFTGRTLEVRSVAVTGSGRRLECLCEEIQR
jgi:SPP1 family predicted phage head-tail adaptor